MTCITTAKRFPKRKERASIFSAGLTLLSNALMLNQSNWVWAQQKSMGSLSSPMSNTHTLKNLPKRFSYYPLWTKISNVFIEFLQKVLLYLPFISILECCENPQSTSSVEFTCVSLMCINIWKLLMLYRKYCLGSSFLTAQESKLPGKASWAEP